MNKAVENQYEDFLLAKELEGVAQTTIRTYYFTIAKALVAIDPRDVKKVTTTEIRKYVMGLTVCDVTKTIVIKNLRVFFNWLKAEGVIDDSPMDRIKTPKIPNVFPHVLDEKDVLKIIQTAKKQSRNLAVVLMMLDTGIRVSELCDLTDDDVDLKTRTAIIRHGKGNKSRAVYFSPVTARAISRYVQRRPDVYDDSLFLSQRTRCQMERCAVGRMIKRLGERAGIDPNKRVSPHTFRHTFATMYVKNGGDPHSLQSLMGHSTTRMAEKYVHLAGVDVEKIYKRCSPVQHLI